MLKNQSETVSKSKKRPDIIRQRALRNSENADAAELFERLRALRRKIADEQNVPAFVVFSDATLRQMSREMPADEESFLQISGVGLNKLKRYGAIFIKEIGAYIADKH